MKTILVPTDFSPSATNAAMYALEIARETRANIKLCNAIQAPLETVYAEPGIWPAYDTDQLKAAAEAELNFLSDSLVNKYPFSEREFRPYIYRSTGIGDAANYVTNIAADDHINLVVMGMSGSNVFSQFIFGSTTRSLIDKAAFPLILIPKSFSYEPIKKIGFASDLALSDIEALNSLANFAASFNAEILITHVTEPAHNDHKQVDAFLNEVTCKVNYPRIYYRDILNEPVNDGLKRFTTYGQVDLLVMTHRSKKFLKTSHTQKLASDSPIPLMVLPEGFKSFLP